MSKPKVSGEFVEAFAASAGSVSPVFERKIQEYLKHKGIKTIDAESYYSYQEFADAVTKVEDDIGKMTSMDAGIEMIDATGIEDVDSIEEAVEIAKTGQREAYRNYAPEKAGQWRYEQTDSGQFRVAIYGGWEYPEGFTEGIIKGYAAVSKDAVTGSQSRTETRDDEVFAFLIEQQ